MLTRKPSLPSAEGLTPMPRSNQIWDCGFGHARVRKLETRIRDWGTWNTDAETCLDPQRTPFFCLCTPFFGVKGRKKGSFGGSRWVWKLPARRGTLRGGFGILASGIRTLRAKIRKLCLTQKRAIGKYPCNCGTLRKK